MFLLIPVLVTSAASRKVESHIFRKNCFFVSETFIVGSMVILTMVLMTILPFMANMNISLNF